MTTFPASNRFSVFVLAGALILNSSNGRNRSGIGGRRSGCDSDRCDQCRAGRRPDRDEHRDHSESRPRIYGPAHELRGDREEGRYRRSVHGRFHHRLVATGPPNGGREVFDKYFSTLKVANFGIAGDTTQGVLWRLQNGEGQGYNPKAIMLMIGTNNTGRNSAPEIVEGVTAVIGELRKDFPDARILLLAVFPRATPGSPVRGKIDEINFQIAKLSDLDHVFYMDIGPKFLDADGKFAPGVFRADNLHPVAKGYEIWAEAVKEPLANLLKLAK